MQFRTYVHLTEQVKKTTNSNTLLQGKINPNVTSRTGYSLKLNLDKFQNKFKEI